MQTNRLKMHSAHKDIRMWINTQHEYTSKAGTIVAILGNIALKKDNFYFVLVKFEIFNECCVDHLVLTYVTYPLPYT